MVFFGLGGAPAAGASAQKTGEPASRSFFGLQGLPYASPLPRSRVLPAEAHAAEVPDFEKDVEHRTVRAFPVERAVLASLAAHVLLFVFLLTAPAPVSDPRKGLLAALVPPEKSEEDKIPIIFREVPGAPRPNPKKSDLSDADRRASGGDPSKPRAQSPFVAERQGKQGLAPGPRRPPSRPAVPPPGEAERRAEAGRGAAAPLPGEGQAPEPAPQAQEGFVVPRSNENSGQTAGGKTAPVLEGLNQAIRDAARGVGERGEDGAGFPNPGGFVDSEGLSFDTTWYDWGPYAAEMIRRIKLNWDVPELARFGWKGKLTVRFFILADGRVEGATILSGSGVPPFDHAAFQAIVKSNPFRPLPKDLGSDREGVTVTFFYNIRPGETGSGGTN
jgi:TonB family protein